MKIPCFARSMPFSIGSGMRSSLHSAITPLTLLGAFSPSLFNASITIFLASIFCRKKPRVFCLHFGHSSPSSSRWQFSHHLFCALLLPHSSHNTLIPVDLQLPQEKLLASTSITPSPS